MNDIRSVAGLHCSNVNRCIWLVRAAAYFNAFRAADWSDTEMTDLLTNEITIGYDPASPSGDVPCITFMKGGKVLGVLVGEVATLIHNIMQENAKLREALINARHILRVENLLEAWAENVKIIDEALRSCEYRVIEE